MGVRGRRKEEGASKHHTESILTTNLVGVRELVIAAADQKVDLAVREDVLGLQELPGVALVEEVVYPVSVHSDPAGRSPCLGHLLGDLDVVVHTGQLLHRHLLVTERGGQDTASYTEIKSNISEIENPFEFVINI